MHGKDISIPKGTDVTAYINGDTKLDIAKFQPAAPAGPVPTATPTKKKPTNPRDMETAEF